MKTISRILVISMIFSVLASFGVFAADHVQQDIIDTVTQEKIWTFGEFAAEKDVTGAQLAGMIENALGIEDAQSFIPNYADDKAVSRTDLSVAMDKVAFEKVDYYLNRHVIRELYIDTDELSDEQFQSVTNVIYYGIVNALEGKMFNPSENADCITAAKAVLTVRSMAKKGYDYTVRDVTADDNVKAFDVYQTGVLKTNCGVAGFGMVARFDGGPGEIYVARTTVKPLLEHQWGNPAAPVTLVRVVDPDGNIVARVNLDWLDTGKMEKIITVPEGKPGIYQIQFTNGRDGDLCEIAVNNPVSWGIRGEHSFQFTETTPKTGYFYVPKKATDISIATGGPDDKLTLTAPDGQKYELIDEIRCYSLQAIDIENPITDSVYKIEVEDDFRNFFELRGVSQLICPTAAMAKDLKGGFVDVTDEYASLTLAGPLQARARAKMVEIYNKAEGNFEVDRTMPYETLPEDLDNPQAEAQLFSAYYGSISGLDVHLSGQCLDPANPWFGAVVGYKMATGESAYPAEDYQSEHFSHSIFGTSSLAYTGALSLNAQLNGFYGNEQLRDRVALAQLFCVLHMTQDGSIIDSGEPSKSAGSWFLTYTNFRFADWVQDYYTARKMLDDETREIVETAIMLIADKQLGMRGQGPTNQAMMNFYGTAVMYDATGDENYHTFFKRQVDAYFYPSARPSYNGQAEAGYYIESGGPDGSGYEHHNQHYASGAALAYLNLPEGKQDPETKAKLLEGITRNYDYNEKFLTGPTEGLNGVTFTNFASRNRHGLGGGSAYIGNYYLINHLPQASAYWYNTKVNHPVGTTGIYANTPEVAIKHLKSFYPDYDKKFKPSNSRPAVNSLMYQELHEPIAEPADVPYKYQGDYKVWDQPGLVAIKHKGMYMVSFYDSTLPRQSNAQSPKSWFGGAPTFTWIEGMGHTTSSDKPVNYAAIPGNMLQIKNTINYKPYWTEEEMINAAIVGKDKDGNTFASGKERSDLVWLEEGKKFKISGITPLDKKEVSWIYNLTDEGIELTGGVDSIVGQEELWFQLPIVDQSNLNAEFSVTHEKGKLVTEYKGKKMVITWDENLEYKMHDPQPDAKVRTQMLKIKLPKDNPNVTIKMVTE